MPTGESNKFFVDCLICRKQLLEKRTIRKHRHILSGGALCKICIRICGLKDAGHRNGEKCEFCNKELNKMRRKHPGRSAKKYSCEICGKSFTSKQSMQEHGYTHTGERPYQCEICGKFFTQRGNMNAHKRTHDPLYDPHALKYQCDTCGKGYGIGQRASFEEHVAKHKGMIKKYTCHVCDKIIVSLECFKTHMRTHLGEKPFACDVCQKAFSAKKYLITHRRVHTGEKPYHCDLCGKCFSQKGTLNSHRRNHFGAKRFNCDVCDKSFPMKTLFQDHRKFHQ